MVVRKVIILAYCHRHLAFNQQAGQLDCDIRDDLEVHHAVVSHPQAVDGIHVEHSPQGADLYILIDQRQHFFQQCILPRRNTDLNL